MQLHYALGHAIMRLRAPGRLLLALRRWRHGSAALGELGWAQPVLQLPREVPSELALIVVRRLLISAARGCQHRYSWLRACVRVVRSPEVTFARLRINGPAVARGIRRADAQAATPEVRRAALEGADVERIKLYWKLRAPRDVHTIWRSCCEAAASWRASVRGIPCERQALEAVAEEASSPVLAMPPLRIAEAYRAYATSLACQRPDQVLVVEDKDTAAAWLCNRATYAIRCMLYFEMGDAWKRTDMTVEQAAAWTHQFHAPLVQEGVLRPTSLDAWRTSLPSAYTTMKSKCWQTGAHTCMRECHSCVCAAFVRGAGGPTAANCAWRGAHGGSPWSSSGPATRPGRWRTQGATCVRGMRS